MVQYYAFIFRKCAVIDLKMGIRTLLLGGVTYGWGRPCTSLSWR